MEKVVFSSLLSVSKAEPSEVGKPIYEWEYICPVTGEVKRDSRDVEAFIQSYARVVDYKELIEEYGIDNLDSGRNAVYGDVSAYAGMDYADTSAYLRTLASVVNQQIADFEQKKAEKISEQNQQTRIQSSTADKPSNEQGKEQGGKE